MRLLRLSASLIFTFLRSYKSVSQITGILTGLLFNILRYLSISLSLPNSLKLETEIVYAFTVENFRDNFS